MPGELILPLTRKGLVSIEIKLNAPVKKGDLLRAPGAITQIGFCLQSGKKNNVIPLCIACDLVEANFTVFDRGNTTDKVAKLKAGTWLESRVGHLELRVATINNSYERREANQPQAGEFVGIVHRDHSGAVDTSRFEMVFRTILN